MNNKGIISIIVPVYNVENYLDRCINSVVRQTYKDLEIILVDDGSQDRSPGICDEWAKRDDRIKVIHKPNGGVSSARNAGLKIGTGSFVAFVDSDDYLDDQMMEKLLCEMQDSRVGIVECGFIEVIKNNAYDKALQRTRMSAENVIEHILLWDGVIESALWNKLFRRCDLEGLSFCEDLRFGEDTVFLYEVLKKTKEYVQIPFAGYYYVKREDSLVGLGLFKPYKMHSLIAAKRIAGMVEKDYPQFVEQSHCHVAQFAFGLICAMYATLNGEKNYSEEYQQILETLKKSEPSIYGKHLPFKQCMQISLCRIAPCIYRTIFHVWKRMKSSRNG